MPRSSRSASSGATARATTGRARRAARPAGGAGRPAKRRARAAARAVAKPPPEATARPGRKAAAKEPARRAPAAFDGPALFARVRDLLARHAPGLEVRRDTPSAYELYGTKRVTVMGRTVDAMYFAAAVLRRNAVSFYFFPVYTHAARVAVPGRLAGCRSGKSCFQLKAHDEALLRDLERLLRQGAAVYRKAGWI